MTREEQTISNLKKLKSFHNGSYGTDIDRAIKALEQEPCDVFDKYGNYKYPSDVELTEPNTATSVSCEDAISRQAAIDAMYALCNTDETLKENPWRDNPHIDAITDAIEDLPSVNPLSKDYNTIYYTPQPKTGHWINIMVGDMPAQACDQCNTFYPLAYTGGGHRFCPNCGADMRGEQDE